MATLRRQSALLERVQRIAQIGGWELNWRTHALTWTDETYRIHGVTRENYRPTVESAIGFYTPQCQPLIRRALNEVTTKSHPFDLELQIVSQDGAVRWVRSMGRRADDEGEPDLVCGVLQDITDRRLLEEEIIQIAQRERTLLGFDLHDGLGQELTGLAFTLSGILSKIPPSAAPFREELRGVETSVREAIGTCRALAVGLSPTGRERGGFVGAVQHLAARMTKLHSLDVRVRTRGQLWSLEDGVADHLFRITQEAVTNAIKHAHAKRILISLVSNSARTVVSIQNDSHELPAKSPGGMGIKIMHYRARLIGATLTFTNLAGGGTRVRCCLETSSGGRKPGKSG